MPHEYRNSLRSIRLLISEDRGNTWKLHQEIPADGTRFSIKTTKDGLYWFMLQTEQKDGKVAPQKPDRPDQRVYVNADRRPVFRTSVSGFQPPPLPSAPPTELQQLQREVRELRATIENLQKRLDKLEKDRAPK